MSYEQSVRQLKTILDVPPDDRDGFWAYKGCKLSREVIEDILELCPDAQEVKTEIVPLLQEVADSVEQIEKKDMGGSFTAYLPEFHENILDRIAKLNKYRPIVV